MPRVAGDDAVIVISSSSEEERGEGRRRSTSSVRPSHHSAAADSVSGNHMDGVKKKKKKRKEREEEETATAASEGVRRGGEGSRAESEARVKKRKKTEENKEKKRVKKATFHSSCVGGVVAASYGVAGRSPTRSFPMNRAEGLAEGSKGMGGVSKKGKKRKEEISKGGEAGEAQKTEEKKKKGKKNEEEKGKKATSPSFYAKDVVAANGEVGFRSIAGGEGMDGVRKKGNKKRKGRDEETGTVAGGEVPSGVVETRKKKSKEAGKKEKEATSPVSFAGEVVATSDENGCPFPTCSFPMRRVKRLIAGSEGGGGNSGSGNVRTTLDAVFLINKAAELFLELFAQDAYAHATEEHKRSVFYKHLSSTVGNEKRYEFLSDFVPEKVKAADALKALAEQP